MLDRPLRLRCGAVVPHRAVLAPLTNLQSHGDGTLSREERAWLLRRARGGFGWIMTCAAYVSEQGKAWDGQLGVADTAHADALGDLGPAIRGEGPLALVQLHHAGAKATLSPDPISTGGPDGARAATPEDLDHLVASYVDAALRCQDAGFDGVEVHGANGYVFTQFLAPLDNPRTDAWGGGLPGRAKLLRDTVRAVRRAVRPDFVVGVRISPVDVWTQRGLCLADTERLVPWLADDGIDFLHLSLSDAAGPAPHEDGDEPVVTAVRRVLPDDVALVAAGGVWTAGDARAVLDAGADLVALGRSAIGNPDWPRDAATGRAPTRPPFSHEHLASVDVSPRFVAYLERFRDLVTRS